MSERVARVITWVSPIGEPSGQYGTRYTNVKFSDESVGYIGKNDLDDAIAVHARLQERVERDTFFVVEAASPSKKGHPRLKILAFEGYDPKGLLNMGAASQSTTTAAAQRIDSAPTTDTEASIRAAVALKAAVEQVSGNDVSEVLSVADMFDAWLAKKSGAVKSATVPSPGPETPAPASSDGVGDGEAPAPSGASWTERVKTWGENQTAE